MQVIDFAYLNSVCGHFSFKNLGVPAMWGKKIQNFDYSKTAVKILSKFCSHVDYL